MSHTPLRNLVPPQRQTAMALRHGTRHHHHKRGNWTAVHQSDLLTPDAFIIPQMLDKVKIAILRNRTKI